MILLPEKSDFLNTPDSKEAFMYVAIYERHFPHDSAALMIKKWIPRWQVDTDPSGRLYSPRSNLL